MKKEISYIDMAAKKPSIIKQTQEFKDNSMIPTKESGLCLKNDNYCYFEHVQIDPQEIKDARLKVIQCVELKEIDKLKMAKSFYKKILSMFAKKRIDSSTPSIILPNQFGLGIGQIIIAIINANKGTDYKINVIMSIFFLTLFTVGLNVYYKFYPIKTLKYLRLSLLNDKQKNKLNDYIKEKGLNNIVELCDDISEISCYDSDEEELKKIFRIK